MRSLRAIALGIAVACFAGTAWAQQTHAVSRLVTVYSTPGGGTQAASRLATVYSTPPNDTTAFTREVTVYSVPNSLSTRAGSRLVTAWLGFSLPNAAACLAIAAGLRTATAREKAIYDVVTGAPSNNIVDILDAYRVTFYATHPTYLP